LILLAYLAELFGYFKPKTAPFDLICQTCLTKGNILTTYLISGYSLYALEILKFRSKQLPSTIVFVSEASPQTNK